MRAPSAHFNHWDAVGAASLAVGAAMITLSAVATVSASNLLLSAGYLFVFLGLFAGSTGVLLCSLAFLLVTGHETLTLFPLPLFGASIRPRELALAAACLHLMRPSRLQKGLPPEHPVHYAVALYALFFAIAFSVGIYRTQSLQPVSGEARYALFLLTYPVLVMGMRNKSEAFRLAAFVGGLTLLSALCAVLFFVYTLATGSIISEYNTFGAFIQRNILGFTLQSIRPNTVMYYEVCATVLVALLLGASLQRQRGVIVAALGLLSLAMLLTAMRTALVSLAASLLFLAWSALPRPARFWSGAAAVLLLCMSLIMLAAGAQDGIVPSLENAETSVRARWVETIGAWEYFLAHPLAGGGMGASFEGLGLVEKHAHVSYAVREYKNVHNLFLYILYKGGLMGSLLALLGLTGILYCGIKSGDNASAPADRAFLRGITAALAGQCVASATMARLYFPAGHLLVAFAAACLVVFAENATTTAERPRENR